MSTYPIEAEYNHTVSEPKAHYLCKDLVFKTYPNSEEMLHVRINGYRMFPEKMDLSAQIKYYEYFPKLIEMTKEERFVKKFSLQPGNVLLVHNWRLLHGRTGFNGNRILSGCYLGQIDFLSRCRSVGLQVKYPF